MDEQTDRQAARLYVCLGTIEGMRTGLDDIRDGEGSHVRASPVDHNIEQAQIALETASMRLQQVVALLSGKGGVNR